MLGSSAPEARGCTAVPGPAAAVGSLSHQQRCRTGSRASAQAAVACAPPLARQSCQSCKVHACCACKVHMSQRTGTRNMPAAKRSPWRPARSACSVTRPQTLGADSGKGGAAAALGGGADDSAGGACGGWRVGTHPRQFANKDPYASGGSGWVRGAAKWYVRCNSSAGRLRWVSTLCAPIQ